MHDKTASIVISKGENLKTLVSKSLEEIGGIKSYVEEGKVIFIHIDLSFPGGYPATTNPDLLNIVVDLCISTNPKKIYIGCAPLFDISSDFIWENLGYANVFTQDIIEFLPLESKQIEKDEIKLNNSRVLYPIQALEADFLISLVNPKLNLAFDLELSVYKSSAMISYPLRNFNTVVESNNENCFPENNRDKSSDYIAEIYQIKKPDIVILDFSSIMTTPGAFIFSDTNFRNYKTLIISNNGKMVDYIALDICRFNAKENPLIKSLNNYDDSQNPESFDVEKIIFISQVESEENSFDTKNLTQFYKNNNYSLVLQEEHNNGKKNSKEVIKNNNSLPVFPDFPIIQPINKIFTQSAKICKGKTCTICENGLIQFLYLLKSFFIKDIENIDEFAVLIGEKPANPGKKSGIIIFGDCAIQSTSKSDFRTIKTQKQIRTDEEIERETTKYHADIREKTIEWENKKETISQNIKQKIDDPEKLQKALDKLEDKDRKYQENMKGKISIFDEKQKKKREKEKESAKKIKIKPNNHILELKGCPPDGFEYIKELIKFFNKKWTPTLALFKNVIAPFKGKTKKK